MTNLFSLTGQTALVTGGNVGLGQAIAVALAGAGADIVSTSRRAAPETKQAVEALGRRFLGLEADLSSTKPIAGVVEQSLAFGGLDILVTIVGQVRRGGAKY